MRRSMHLGDSSRRMVETPPIKEETIFDPDGAKTDDNPFPEDLQTEEVLIETQPLDYDSITVEELRAICRARELAVGGKKADLIARLMEADAPSQEAVEVTEDAPSQEAASSDENGSISNESERNETTNTVG